MANNCPLKLEETLIRVLLFLDEKSLAACSVVNKQWSPLAIKSLWHSLDSLRPLFGLLAPLQDRQAIEYPKRKGPIWGFDPARTEPWNWERFDAYAVNVKALSINTESYEHYTDFVLSVVSLYRKSLSLLPNLETLTVDCNVHQGIQCNAIDFTVLFLNKSLRNLTLLLGDIDVLTSTGQSLRRALGTVLRIVPERAPDLRSICLESYGIDSGVCTASLSKHGFLLSELLPHLRNLEELYICSTFVHPELLIMLSKLQRLNHINIFCDQHYLSDLTENTEPIVSRRSWVSLGSDQYALTSLQTLEMSSNFSTTIPFLTGIASPNLITLDITAATSDDMKGMLSTVGQKYCLLEKLHLESSHKTAIASAEGADSVWRLDTLQPLTSLTRLKDLSLDCDIPVYLSKSDFESLVTHWPLLEDLHIKPPQGQHGTSYLTPHALALLAKYCPRIHSLTIDIDWGAIETLITGDLFVSPEVHSKYRLSKVTSVSFGWSPIQECQTAAIATFLVDLSISSSAIQLPDIQQRQQTGESTGGQEKKELLERWKDIKKFMTIAAHYRHQIQCLQNRIETLEAQP